MSELATKALLTTSLSVAVPLWIEQFRGKPWEELRAKGEQAATVIASRGDLILYRSTKPGETAAAFNELAKAIAILSFAPGGVKFLDLHFETK